MKKIGIFTSGGDAPGMNACLRAVTRACLYNKLEPYAIVRGYKGMIDGNLYKINSAAVSNIIQRGGTILKSARSERFRTKEGREKAYKQLIKHDIEGLIAMGGDGTFTGMKIFHEEYEIPCVGIPSTIDNDLYGTDYTIGFDTAVNTAIEAIDKIRDTADSHDRAFFVEVMGRATGYIAIQTGISTGAEFVLMPESFYSVEDIVKTLQKSRNNQKFSFLVIVAEGNNLGDAHDLGLKVKEKMPRMDIRVTTLGHIQRGGAPTANDRILASQLGLAAVEALVKGKTNITVGMVNNKLKHTSLNDSISKKKMLDINLIRMVNILSS